MFDFKTIATAAVTAVIVVVLAGLVGDDQLGSGTRFPNGISADSTSPSAGEVRGTTLTSTGAVSFGGAVTFDSTLSSGTATTSTTTIAVGKVCYSFTDVDGTDLYGWYTSDGTFSTSTASCS